MSDTVLDFMRTRFDRLDAGQARIDRKLDELTTRVGRVERLVADLHVQAAEHSIRMDRMDQRLDRIERLVDVVDVGS